MEGITAAACLERATFYQLTGMENVQVIEVAAFAICAAEQVQAGG